MSNCALIPIFVDLEECLTKFLRENDRKYIDSRLTDLYDTLLQNEDSASKIAASLEECVKDRISPRFQAEPPTDEEIFGQTYTKIVKSPAAMDLIQLEHSFAKAVETEVIERNRVLAELQKRFF